MLLGSVVGPLLPGEAGAAAEVLDPIRGERSKLAARNSTGDRLPL